MRVLHLNSLLNGGGTDEHCIALLKALCAQGIEAALAGPGGRSGSTRVQAQGGHLHELPPGKTGLILGTARVLRRGQFQILHAHHGRDIWPAILARKLAGTKAKLVLTRHLAKAPSSWPSRRFVLGQCDALIAVSDFVAMLLREGASEATAELAERRKRPPLSGDKSKIIVIHNGIDTAKFRPGDASALRREWGLGPDHFAFGVVGTYDRPRGKGQDLLLKAAALVRSQMPRARFLIIGRGNLRDQLSEEIHRLGLNDIASLTPYCQDMPAAMNALDCLVHPQIGTEAFGLVLIEAFACGRPVIASRLDGIPEAFVAGALGELVEPGAVPALAEALVRQYKQPVLSEAQRVALHDSIEAEFSIQTMANKVIQLYRDLLNQGRPSQRQGPGVTAAAANR